MKTRRRRRRATAGSQLLNWREFVSKLTTIAGHWVYRGGLPATRHETTLERVCRAWKIPLSSAPDLERRLVREFKRHPEAQGTAVENDLLACFALMQHHGAPTRLLDWTYSPYVAAYFALDALFDASMDEAAPAAAAVWAIDLDWLTRRIKLRLSSSDWQLYSENTKEPEAFARLFVNKTRPIRFVGTATPLQLNPRLSVQQGVFLCPGDITRPWMDNFAAIAGSGAPAKIKQFLIDRNSMEEAFDGLSRMNVTARTLFPGLDGYAKSISHRAQLLRRFELPRI